MPLASEVVQYGEEVLGEFVFGTAQSWIENHELAAVFLNEESEQVEPEAAESVAVGNHKLELVAAQKSFQYGVKPFALEIESRADVFDDFGLRVERGEPLHLSLEVVALFVAADPAIADDDGALGDAQESVNVEQPLSRCVSDAGDDSPIGVSPKSIRMQAKALDRLSQRDVGHVAA